MLWENKYKNKMKKINSGLTMSFAFSDKSELEKLSKKYVLEKMKVNGLELRYVNENFKNDEEIVLAALKENFDAKKWVGEKIKLDENWKKKAKKSSMELYCDEYESFNMVKYVFKNIEEENEKKFELLIKDLNPNEDEKEEIKVIWNAVKENRLDVFDKTTIKYKNNKTFILFLLDYNANIIKHIDDDFKNDFDIAKNCLLRTLSRPENIEFLGENIKNSDEFAELIIKYNPILIKFLSSRLRRDRKFVEKAINGNGLALLSADKDLINDKELVLLAIKKAAIIVKYLDSICMKDREVCLQAVIRFSDAMLHIGEKWLNDRDFLIDALKRGGTILQHIPEHLIDEEIILLQLKNKASDFTHMRGFENNKKIAFEAIKRCAYNIALFGDEIKNDIFFVKLALDKDFSNIQNVGEKFKDDDSFLKEYVDDETFSLRYLGNKIKNNKKIVEKLLKKDLSEFEYVGEKLKRNYYFVNKYLKKDPTLLFVCSERYWTKKNIINVLKYDETSLHRIKQKMGEDLDNMLNNMEISFIKYLTLSGVNYNYIGQWKESMEIIFHALSNNRRIFSLNPFDAFNLFNIFDGIPQGIKDDKEFLFKIRNFIEKDSDEEILLKKYEREEELKVLTLNNMKDITLKEKRQKI